MQGKKCKGPEKEMKQQKQSEEFASLPVSRYRSYRDLLQRSKK